MSNTIVHISSIEQLRDLSNSSKILKYASVEALDNFRKWVKMVMKYGGIPSKDSPNVKRFTNYNYLVITAKKSIKFCICKQERFQKMTKVVL